MLHTAEVCRTACGPKLLNGVQRRHPEWVRWWQQPVETVQVGMHTKCAKRTESPSPIDAPTRRWCMIVILQARSSISSLRTATLGMRTGSRKDRFPCISVTRICACAKLVHCRYILFSLWLVFLFLNLVLVLDSRVVPNINTVAKTLGMSDSLAGVTLLAFGNGAADVFSAAAAVR